MTEVGKGSRITATGATQTNWDKESNRQPIFKWPSKDKYKEWRQFQMEVTKNFMHYDIHEEEKVTIVKNWLGRKVSKVHRHLQKQNKNHAKPLLGYSKWPKNEKIQRT